MTSALLADVRLGEQRDDFGGADEFDGVGQLRALGSAPGSRSTTPTTFKSNSSEVGEGFVEGDDDVDATSMA